jgi:hypothetical protein
VIVVGDRSAASSPARRAHGQRARARQQLTGRRLAIADDLGPASLVPGRTMPSDVVLDFRLEHLLQHHQRSALQYLVQRLSQFLVLFRRLLDYSQQGWRLLHPVAKPGRVL